MIQTPTVFITGAGASVEYGLPLGADLVKRVVLLTRQPNSGLRQALAKAGVSIADAEAFSTRLSGSDPSSIDTFLENNTEEFIRIGKAAIALVILLAEGHCLELGRLGPEPPKDHWLKYIWNLALAGCTAATLATNRVSFVTFNYDRALETYLDGVIRNAFGLEGSEARELREQAFPIVHLHGAVSGVEFGADPGELLNGRLEETAEGIKVIHEAIPQDDPAFRRAFELLRGALLVCCLGFGYHPTNVQRLRVKDLMRTPSAKFCGSAYGMGTAEIKQAEGPLRLEIDRLSKGLKCEAFLRERVVLA